LQGVAGCCKTHVLEYRSPFVFEIQKSFCIRIQKERVSNTGVMAQSANEWVMAQNTNALCHDSVPWLCAMTHSFVQMLCAMTLAQMLCAHALNSWTHSFDSNEWVIMNNKWALMWSTQMRAHSFDSEWALIWGTQMRYSKRVISNEWALIWGTQMNEWALIWSTQIHSLILSKMRYSKRLSFEYLKWELIHLTQVNEFSFIWVIHLTQVNEFSCECSILLCANALTHMNEFIWISNEWLK